MRFRPITISLSPNTEPDDIWLAVKIMLRPDVWKQGNAIYAVKQWFCDYFAVGQAVSFNSGRSAMLAILKAFDIGKGDDVLVQSFTCVAVPNSVLWAGATPIYVDIDASLNMDPQDAEKKITKKTKAIIVQHTFGIPAQIDKLAALAKKHHLVLIEDCAHALGATYKGKKLGSYGDAAFFSFGRDKVVSSVFGGMAIINSNLKTQISKLKQYHDQLPYPSYFWIFQQLFHPIAFSVILASYNLIFGKLLLVFLQKLHLLSFPVYPEEKKGLRPSNFPAKFPNALAILLLRQLKKLDGFNENRRRIADYYRNQLNKGEFTLAPHREGAIYLRFPVLLPQPTQVIHHARRHGVYLGNWYHNGIDPTGVDFSAIGYQPGSCPKAEEAARHVMNLPTRITSDQARDVLASFV